MTARLRAWDTFTESSNTAIASHSPEVGGGGWVGAGTWSVRGGTGYVSTTGASNLATMTNSRVGNGSVVGTFDAGLVNTGPGPCIRGIIDGSTWNRRFYFAYCQFTTNEFTVYQIRLYRVTAGSFTQLTSVNKTAVAFPIKCRIRASGSSATSLDARFWQASAAEPLEWDTSTTENTAANQTTAQAPVGIYLESESTYSGANCSELIGVEEFVEPRYINGAVARAAVF